MRRITVVIILFMLLGGCGQSAGTSAPVQATTSPSAAVTLSVTATPPPSATGTQPVLLTPTAAAAIESATSAATAAASPALRTPPDYTFEVVNVYPHDPQAFTQGLVIDDGRWFEGTGLYGRSSIREVDLLTGEVLRSQSLADEYFGEGITILGDHIYQLTWRENTGFVRDKDTFDVVKEFTYPHEGWGITHDGQRLIVSDGTAVIRYYDPESLKEIGTITVRDGAGAVSNLNELEYVNGEIWANIWQTDNIARISPETGEVLGYIDLTGLLDPATLTEPVDVLNGIAYDASTDRLFVTGKLWPSVFEIRVVPATPSPGD